MYLKQTRRGNRTYLSIVQNYRSEGHVRAKTIESLGYVDELAKTYPDPIAHFKEYAAQMNEAAAQADAPIKLTIPRDAHITPGHADVISLGHALCFAYLEALDVSTFFSKSTENHLVGRVFEMMAASRMMHAEPLHQTWSNRLTLPKSMNFSFAQMYETLPTIAQHASAYTAHLSARYQTLRGRTGLNNVRVVLSNYLFEWPEQDQEKPQESSTKVLQSRLCVAIDSKGIPLTYKVVPSQLSPSDIHHLLDEIQVETEAKRVTLVAADIPQADEVMAAVAEAGEGFILLVPSAQASDALRSWVHEPDGYALSNNGLYLLKSRKESQAFSGSKSALPCKEIAFKGSGNTPGEPFCIVSSETQLSDASVFNMYRELWRVHEPFQIMQADFISVPYPVDMRTHLEAHFAISYAAFFTLRVMREDMGWKYNAAAVANALSNMEGAYLDENWYLFNYRSEVTDLIERTCGLDAGRRIMSRKDIHQTISQAKQTVTRMHTRRSK